MAATEWAIAHPINMLAEALLHTRKTFGISSVMHPYSVFLLTFKHFIVPSFLYY